MMNCKVIIPLTTDYELQGQANVRPGKLQDGMFEVFLDVLLEEAATIGGLLKKGCS